MRPPLDGASVLVTGASSGIGRELARLFAERAGTLILVARRRERMEELSRELQKERPALRVVVVACDIGDRAAIDGMLGDLAKDGIDVDVLVNNAGLGDLGMFDRADWDKTERMITLNVTNLVYLTHRLLGPMVARGRGGILNVSSGWGLTFGPGMAVYIATKHFVTGFSEALRIDLAGTGVSVTQVCPGPVATEFAENVGNFTGVEVPKLIEISAMACARSAYRGFAKGRALVVPGLVMKLLVLLSGTTPRWVLRLFHAPIAKALRRKQLAVG